MGNSESSEYRAELPQTSVDYQHRARRSDSSQSFFRLPSSSEGAQIAELEHLMGTVRPGEDPEEKTSQQVFKVLDSIQDHISRISNPHILLGIKSSPVFFPFLKSLVGMQERTDRALQAICSKLLYSFLSGGEPSWNSDSITPVGIQSQSSAIRSAYLSDIDDFLLQQCRFPYPLVHLLLSSDNATAKHATGCLSLLLSRNGPEFMIESDAITLSLVDSLANNVVSLDPELQLVSITCLTSISANPVTHDAIVNAGTLDHLGALLQRNSTTPSVRSAAALGARLLIQRSPFQCYKKLESKGPNSESMITTLMQTVRSYFQEFPTLCSIHKTSSILDFIIILTVCTRSESILRLMQSGSSSDDIVQLALLCSQVLDSQKNSAQVAHLEAGVSQLLLHLAMLEDSLSVLVQAGKHEVVKRIIMVSCQHNGVSSNYLDLHATDSEILQRQSRHLMYRGRVLSRLTHYLVYIRDGDSRKINIDQIVTTVIIPELKRILGNGEWFLSDDELTKAIRNPGTQTQALNFSSISAALSSLGFLLLREQWAECIFESRSAGIFSVLKKGAFRCLLTCQGFNQLQLDEGSIPEDQIATAGHASGILHLVTRVFSNLAMYPNLLAGQNEFVIGLWKFFSASSNVRLIFAVPRSFLMATNPSLPQSSNPRVAESDTHTENVALQVAFVEACLGKAMIQMSFRHLMHFSTPPGTPETANAESEGNGEGSIQRLFFRSFSKSTLEDLDQKQALPSNQAQNSDDAFLTGAAQWILFARDLMNQYSDDQISAKCFSLECQAVSCLGWISLWKKVLQCTSLEGNRSSTAEISLLWGPAFADQLREECNKILRHDSAETPFATLREISRLLLAITCQDGFEHQYHLCLHLKFKNAQTLESEYSGLVAIDGGALTSLCKPLGEPQHLNRVEIASTDIGFIGVQSPWGITFKHECDAILVSSSRVCLHGLERSNEQFSKDGWTVSLWVRQLPSNRDDGFEDNRLDEPTSLHNDSFLYDFDQEENNRTRTRLRTVIFSSCGCHPIAFLESDRGLELGCYQSAPKEEEVGLGDASRTIGIHGKSLDEDIWHGSGFDMNSLEAGWHHVIAHSNGISTSFYVDRNPVGVKIPFAVARSSVAMIGNNPHLDTVFHPDWAIADLRVYCSSIPLNVIGGTPARVSLNRRPWGAGHSWDISHEYTRTKVGEDFTAILIYMLETDISEIQHEAAKTLVNVLTQRQSIFRVIENAGFATLVKLAHSAADEARDSLSVESFIDRKKSLTRVLLKFVLARMK